MWQTPPAAKPSSIEMNNSVFSQMQRDAKDQVSAKTYLRFLRLLAPPKATQIPPVMATSNSPT